MKFLIDGSPAKVAEKLAMHPSLVVGQLRTPLTSNQHWGGCYAIDNGAFTKFDERSFTALLSRSAPSHCLFVAAPDIPGAAQRTLELFAQRHRWIGEDWPVALVAQDGIESLPIPWDEMDAVFIGGLDPWKDSRASLDVVKTAKILGKHVHVGRVNTPRRFNRFAEAGADTCDGSGVSRYDWMLEQIAKVHACDLPLFEQ